MVQESTTTDTITTIGVTGYSQGPKSTHVEAANAEFVIGKEASPLEYLFGSLAACINVIGHLVAKDHEFVIDDMDIHVEGDIDTAKYKGESSEPRAGFQTIRVRVAVDSAADDESLTAWLNEVADRCPVADNLSNASEVDVTVERASSDA